MIHWANWATHDDMSTLFGVRDIPGKALNVCFFPGFWRPRWDWRNKQMARIDSVKVIARVMNLKNNAE